MAMQSFVTALSKSAMRKIVLKEKRKKRVTDTKDRETKKALAKERRKPIVYYFEDFVVVKTNKVSKFFYCRLESDVRDGDASIPVRELKQSPKNPIQFVLSGRTTVEASKIVTELALEATHKKNVLEIPRREKLRVKALLRSVTKEAMSAVGEVSDDDDDDDDEDDEAVVEDEDDEEEEEDEVMEEDVAAEEEESKTPGKKRGRPRKTAAATEPTGKKRKTDTGKKEVKKRVPKVKLPKYKKGKDNPFVKEVESSDVWDGASNEIDDKCCTFCTNKNLIRAVVSGNKKLFESVFDSKSQISSFAQTWSAHVQKGPLEEAILHKNKDFIKALMEAKPDDPSYKGKKGKKIHFERAVAPTIRVNQQGTGKYDHRTFKHRVRALNMSRGNREGNNAFLHDAGSARNDDYHRWDGTVFAQTLVLPGITDEIVDFCMALNTDMMNTIFDSWVHVIRSGNHELAAHMGKKMFDKNAYGLNTVHTDILTMTDKNADTVLKGIKPISATKKANSNFRVTPMHCAAINPCDQAMRKIYELNKDINIVDDQGRKPIHYAAGSSADVALKFLLEIGSNYRDIDNFKVTPLMVAAEQNRPHNIEVMTKDGDVPYMNQKNKEGFAAIHYAAGKGASEAIKALVDGGANIELTGKERMTALHYAAKQGHLATVEQLLELGAKITKKDKFKRTALLLAVMNGHTLIANLLLRKGGEFDAPDSSKNTPLHYAAAYGWHEMIPMLVQAGANLNAFNDWKITPLGAAVLKCHTRCVEVLLKNEIDVNCKDDEGKSLLSLSLESFNKGNVEQIKYLVNEKKADVNMADNEGMAPIHYLCAYDYPQQFTADGQEEKRKKLVEEYQQYEIELLDTLIDAGADVNAMSKRGLTPFFIALKEEKSHILDFLTKKKVNFRAKTSSNEGLFHMAADSIFDESIQEFIVSIMKDKATTKELINLVNDEGFTPLLKITQALSTGLPSHQQAIEQTLRAEAELKKAEADKAQNGAAGDDDDDDEDAELKIDDDDDDEDDDDSDDDDEDSDDSAPPRRRVAKKAPRKTMAKKMPARKMPARKMAAPKKRAGGRTKQTARKSFPAGGLGWSTAIAAPSSGGMFGTVSMGIDEEQLKKDVEAHFTGDVDKAIVFLGKLIDAGANVKSQVEKLKKYRKDSKPDKKSGKKGAKKDVEGDTEMDGGEATADGSDEEEEEESPPDLNTDDESEVENVEDVDAVDDSDDEDDNIGGFGYRQKKPKHAKVWDFESKSFVIKEFGRFGLASVLHFASETDSTKIVEFLISRGADINARNWNGDIPLQIALNHDDKVVSHLIDAGSNVSNINRKGEDSLLVASKHGVDNKLIEIILDKGASPNVVSHRNRCAMKLAVSGEDVDLIRTLLKKGADVNIKDKKGRTPLHHAINNSQASGDASFDTEHLLLKNSADVNAVDALGRTPLHYAFIKVGGHEEVDNIDPIEAVSSLAAQDGIKLNHKDRWGKTPLHYASQRGATCAAVHLINKGADVNLPDNENNTPLGIAFMRGHSNYAFVLIQNKANVNIPLNFCAQKEWRAAAEKASVSHQRSQARARNTRSVFGKAPRRQLARKSARKTTGFGGGFGGFGGGYNYGYNNNSSGRTYMEGEEEMQDSSNYSSDGSNFTIAYGVYSYFRIAVHRGWQGIAYMLLDYDYDYMRALQDAMIEQKFKLVHTLLSKDPKGEVLRKLNEDKQNLIHIMGIHGTEVDQELATGILDDLQEKGLDVNHKDKDGRTPLHHASANHFQVMVDYLLTKGVDVNAEDNDQHTPLALAIKDDGIYAANEIVNVLQKNGANVNLHVTSTVEHEQTRVTPLLQAIVKDIADPEFKIVNSMLGLGCDVNAVDDKGRNAIIYAIRMNNEKLLDFLLKNDKVKKNVIDNDGKTPVHHVVNPRKFGSYENAKILKLLHSHKFSVTDKDKAGKVPLFYASTQESGVMEKALKKLGAKDVKTALKRAQTSVAMRDWPESEFDPSHDAKEYVKKLEKSAKKATKPEDDKVKPDPEGEFGKIHEVVCGEGGDEDAFDAIMTKIDVKNGQWSENLFYKMQLIKDNNRDMFILFTRWGRIGARGQFQKTPFGELDEATKEFKKVFKQKSGNEWEARDDFQKIPKKFQLLKFEKQYVKQEELLTPFDLDKCPESDLPEELQKVMRQVINTSMYVRSMQSSGIDTELLPLGQLTPATIKKAEGYLKEISGLIKDKVDLWKDITKAGQMEKVWELENSIYDLSSRFYEIIPHAGFVNKPIPAIDNEQELANKFNMLQNLNDFEVVSKLMLGAHQNKKTVNPMDYVFSALNIKLEPLNKEENEFLTLMEYIRNTGQDDNIDKRIKNVFVLQRRGEAESFSKWKKIGNQKLLFHGSKISNFMGIMSQGLKIAPPWAPITGWAFGKGIYLADMFSKSSGYCSDYNVDSDESKDKFMLMCETALGKPFKTNETLAIETAKKGTHSTEAVGRTKPDPDSTIILPNGCAIPIGKLVDVQTTNSWFGQSEYIVYEESQVRLRYLIQFNDSA